MAQSRVQTTSVTPGFTYSTAITASWGKAPANGDSLALIICYNNGNSNKVSSIKESGATWTRVAGASDGSAAELWVATGISGASTSVTISASTSLEEFGCVGVEYSGVSGIDKVVTDTGTGPSVSSGTTSTTSQASEVWVSAFFGYSYSPLKYSSPSNGYSIADQTSSIYGLCICDKVATSTGAAGGTVTESLSSVPSVGFSFTFKASSTPVTTVTPTRVQTMQVAPGGSVVPSISNSWPSVPRNGDTLVLIVCYNFNSSNLITSITQTGANWQRVSGGLNGSGSELWVACGVENASSAIKITANQAVEDFGCVGVEYSGVQNVDTFTSNTGTSTPLSSGTQSTKVANEMWVSGFFTYTYNGGTYSSPSNGYGIAAQTNSVYPMCICDKVASSTGTAGNTVTENVSGSKYVGFSLGLAPGIGLTSAVSGSSGTATLTWNGSSLTGDTVKVYSAASPSMANSTLVTTSSSTAGSVQVTCKPWTPTYYQAEAVGSSTVYSSVVLCFNNTNSNPWSGVETVELWYDGWSAGSGSGSTISKIGKPSLLVGIASSQEYSDCANAGIGYLPYMTLYQTQGWANPITSSMSLSAIEALVGGIAFQGPEGLVPSIYTTAYDATDPNSVTFRNQVFNYSNTESSVSNGFFIDNGYPDPALVNSVSGTSFHSAYVPGMTAGQSYAELVLDLASKMKQANPNKYVIVNGEIGDITNPSYYGYNLSDFVDAFCSENFLFGNGSSAFNWAFTYGWGKTFESNNLAWRAKWLVVSYCTTTDQVFFSYATAKLDNLSYACNEGADGAQGHNGVWPVINSLRLGSPSDSTVGGHQSGSMYYRQYANGFVLVNPSSSSQTFTLPSALQKSRLDVYSQSTLSASTTTVTLPANSGRVYTWK